MATAIKPTGPHSWAAERELMELAKTMDLKAIVKTTGRSRESILKIARRLGIKIKGRKAANRVVRTALRVLA
jgi:hypothetical protein